MLRLAALALAGVPLLAQSQPAPPTPVPAPPPARLPAPQAPDARTPNLPAKFPPPPDPGVAWRVVYERIEDNADVAFNDLRFTSPQHGVATGALAKPFDHPRGFLLVTRDGGAAWREVKINGIGLSLAFVDSSTGWLVTSEGLWMTVEGGFSWVKRKAPDGLRRVYFKDAANGFGFGAGKKVYRTADSGKSWSVVPESEKLPITSPQTGFQWMEFVNPDVGLLVGSSQPVRRFRNPADRVPDWVDPDTPENRRALPASLLVMETRDGGASWKSGVSSVFGTVLRVRMRGRLAMVLFQFPGSFIFPSEILSVDLGTGKSEPYFRRQELRVTDLAILPDGTIMLTGIDTPGRVRTSPIPAQVRVLRVQSTGEVFEQKVSYKAQGTRAILTAAGAEDMWIATDQGQIIKAGPANRPNQ